VGWWGVASRSSAAEREHGGWQHELEQGGLAASSGAGATGASDARRRQPYRVGQGTKVGRRHVGPMATVLGLNPVNRVKNSSNRIEFKFETRSNFF
jgi:hypothetical protein